MKQTIENPRGLLLHDGQREAGSAEIDGKKITWEARCCKSAAARLGISASTWLCPKWPHRFRKPLQTLVGAAWSLWSWTASRSSA